MWETDSVVRNRLNQQELFKYSKTYWKDHFGNTYTKTETMQRLAWPLHKMIHKSLRCSIFFFRKGKKWLSVMDWIMFPPSPYVEALTLNVIYLEIEPLK